MQFVFAGDGPFPGVMDLYGSSGGLQDFRSALLASRGFACLHLPYFGYEDLPENFSDIDFDYFMVRMGSVRTSKHLFPKVVV